MSEDGTDRRVDPFVLVGFPVSRPRDNSELFHRRTMLHPRKLAETANEGVRLWGTGKATLAPVREQACWAVQWRRG